MYTLVDSILYFKLYTPWQAKNVLALPPSSVGDVLQSLYESLTSGTHSEISRIYNKIRDKYNWKNMSANITKSAFLFRMAKITSQTDMVLRGCYKLMVPSSRPFSEIIIDFLLPMSKSNK